MFRRFWNDRRGNIAVTTVIASIPLLGAIGFGIDYAEMMRERQMTQDAVDAASLATAKRITEGLGDDAAKAYAKEFFLANVSGLDKSSTALDILLPSQNTLTGTLKITATLQYKPYFMGAVSALVDKSVDVLPFSASSEVRLKNTIEVALVLDNSGSMSFLGKNSSKKRMDLLKEAAKTLVTTMSSGAALMKQVKQPVRFAVVPFAASVNVGPDNKSASWMDTTGLSPVHMPAEFVDWQTIPAAKGADWKVEQVGNAWYGRGKNWADYGLKDKPLTRFALYDNILKRVTSVKSDGSPVLEAATSWAGCVEVRPYPLNLNDETPAGSKPSSYFVPMFAPDEYDPIRYNEHDYPSLNGWWPDGTDLARSLQSTAEYRRRQTDAVKFLTPAPLKADGSAKPFMGIDTGGDYVGPNSSCTTKPITPLTDISTQTGMDAITGAIDKMEPQGATNVPEGLAWGWRVLSSTSPFTEGRSEVEKGNDKVVIVLTDGANTYYTPDSLGAYDAASNRSSYSSFGYAGMPFDNSATTRIFADPAKTFDRTDYTNPNYTKAMNAQFATLCANAAFVRQASGQGARTGKVTVMTIALDLDEKDADEKTQIAALKSCASPSRNDPTKVLFWNATGATLKLVFKDIANELSNLRIVG